MIKSFFAMILLAVFAVGCSDSVESDKKTLVGKWGYIDVKASKNLFNFESNELSERLIINSNGEVNFLGYRKNQNENGHWKLMGDGKVSIDIEGREDLKIIGAYSQKGAAYLMNLDVKYGAKKQTVHLVRYDALKRVRFQSRNAYEILLNGQAVAIVDKKGNIHDVVEKSGGGLTLFQPTIDTSSKQSFEKSADKIYKSLKGKEKKEFKNAAEAFILAASFSSKRKQKQAFDEVNGLTGSEFIEVVRKMM